MADETTTREKRQFKTFAYRGVELKDLLELPPVELAQLLDARSRRHLKRDKSFKTSNFMKKLRKAKLAVTDSTEKPEVVKTHTRNMVILPEMVGSVIGVYNGKSFNTVEIRPEMIGHFLGEFSITYKPVKHGRPGIGATASSKFVPLK